MKALMAVANAWNAPFQVGSHQIARGLLARGWQVAFISDPISPLHLFKGINEGLRQRIDNHQAGGVWREEGRLWEYVPGALLTPHQFPGLNSAWMYRNWCRLSLPDVVTKVRSAGFGEVDLLYTDVVSQAFWFDVLRWRKSIFRITDNYRAFRKFTRSASEMEAHVARKADLCVYCAASMTAHVAALSPRKNAFVPNGVNYEHFRREMELPREYRETPEPRVVYAGALEEWFDFETVGVLAERMPDVQFVLIGPEQLALKRLHPAANLHLLGPRPYASLPAYLQHAQAGIITFDVRGHADLVDHIHPLKLYEYAASGLPVVASTWEELRLMGSPAVLCAGTDEFERALRAALEKPPSKDALRRYAAAADWQMRLDTIMSALEM